MLASEVTTYSHLAAALFFRGKPGRRIVDISLLFTPPPCYNPCLHTAKNSQCSIKKGGTNRHHCASRLLTVVFAYKLSPSEIGKGAQKGQSKTDGAVSLSSNPSIL
ncbi:hypothetical protein XENOCAPTIV_028585 [Xenoophorus captivus]|uniref:Uncharacterized protein n=1 Tax=Xenoophorus captivus TaxID=1517983 RepID=A0ABV0QNH2_9TELE